MCVLGQGPNIKYRMCGVSAQFLGADFFILHLWRIIRSECVLNTCFYPLGYLSSSTTWFFKKCHCFKISVYVCMSMHQGVLLILGFCRYQEKVSDPLELKFQEFVNCWMDAENWTWVLSKSRIYFSVLGHLSSPTTRCLRDSLIRDYARSLA